MNDSDRNEVRTAAATAEDGVLGTITVQLDGEDRSWYVVHGQSRSGRYASAVWQEWEGGDTLVSISGLDTATPPVAEFESNAETGVTSLGDYSGSSFSITVPITSRDGPRRFRFPAADNGAASVVYVPEAASMVSGMDMTNVFSLVEGVIELAAAEVSDGKAAVRGTFSGTLESMEGGRLISLANGHFEARDIPYVAAVGTGQ